MHEEWISLSRELLFEMGWALKSSHGALSRGEVVGLATTSLASLLGLDRWTMAQGSSKAEFLAYEVRDAHPEKTWVRADSLACTRAMR